MFDHAKCVKARDRAEEGLMFDHAKRVKALEINPRRG